MNSLYKKPFNFLGPKKIYLAKVFKKNGVFTIGKAIIIIRV
jgi:hypothetical protein